MSKAIVAAFLIFAGAILLIFSVSGTWYSTKLDSEVGGAKYTVRTEYRFFEIKSTNTTTKVIPWQSTYDGAGRSITGYLMLAVFGLIAVALAFGLTAGLLGIKGSFGAGGNVVLVTKLSLVSAVLAMVMPIVFAIAFPLTIGADTAGCPKMGPCDGLMGSGTNGIEHGTWGPTALYFGTIAAAILMMIGRRLLPTEFQDIRKQPLRPRVAGAQGARVPGGAQWQGQSQGQGQAQWPADMWGAPPDQQQQSPPDWQGPRQP